MDRLAASKEQARAMGEAGLERYRALDISWRHVVAALTGAEGAEAPGPAPAKLDAPPASRVAKGGGHRLSTSDWLDPAAGQGASLEAIAERYGFDDHLARHRSYYETHWPRYQASLEVLLRAGVKPRRILELGTSEPYVFTAFLKEAFPEAQFTVIQESPAGLNWRHQIKGRKSADIDIAVFGLNAETDRLPFVDGDFDLVVAMEILEHFALDPGFVFREAQRVLCEGGGFFVTTPNLVSLQGVARALNGASPYSFGVFVPWNGAYGRHNREYTPLEVESLGRYAGFESALLDTADVYRQDEAPQALVRYMSERQHPLDLRGQNIFYLGRKRADAAPAPYPQNLFPIDPAVFSGEIQLQRVQAAEDGFIVRIVNVSPLTWLASGPRRIRLTVDRVDQNGLVALDAQSFDLPADVAPGEALDIPIKAVKGSGVFGCWHEIGLYAEGAGPFKGAGRARTVCVFAETLQEADFAHDGDAA